jgi:ribosome maturation factor RimP
VLEVSSPGVDRPLVEPRHWRRAIGRLVACETAMGRVTGRLKAVDDSAVTLDVAGGVRRIAWPELHRGKVQVEFSHGADEGGE